jgi:hypothetical protein
MRALLRDELESILDQLDRVRNALRDALGADCAEECARPECYRARYALRQITENLKNSLEWADSVETAQQPKPPCRLDHDHSKQPGWCTP